MQRSPLRQSILPVSVLLGSGLYAAALFAGTPADDPFTGYDTGGYDTGACDDQDFPLVMAFRPSTGWTGAAANGEVRRLDSSSETVSATDSFRCAEYVHDGDPDFINEVEQHYSGTPGHHDVTTIWHGSWATISQTRVAAMTLCDGTASLGCIYAGHLLAEVGSVLTSTPSGTKIYVEDNAPFVSSFDRYALVHSYTQTATASPDTHDCAGTVNGWAVTHNWLDEPELVLVTGTGSDGGGEYITIDAAMSGSWTVSGSNGLWIAPVALTWNEEGSYKNFAINISYSSPSWTVSTAPPVEATGWWFYATWMTDEEYNGRLDTSLTYPANAAKSGDVRPDGIELDGARWRPDTGNFARDFADINNDLCVDRGYLNGYPDYGLGGALFSEMLRDNLGSSVILQADSSTPAFGYRGYEFFNGVEIENFEEAIKPISEDNRGTDDPQGSSGSFTLLSQWVERATDPLSYPLVKEATEFYGCEPDTGGAEYGDNRYFRDGATAAWLLGMPSAYAAEEHSTGNKCFNFYEWPEYRGGTGFMNWDWLGQPIDVMERDTSGLGANLLTGTMTWSTWKKPCDRAGSGSASTGTPSYVSGKGYELTVAAGTGVCTTLGAFPDASDGKLRVTFPHTTTTSGETLYTVAFSAFATNTWPGGAGYSGVVSEIPRLIRVKVVYEDQSSSVSWGLFQDVLVDVDAGNASSYLLSFLVPDDAEIWKLEFQSAEQPGSIWIDDVELYEGGADRFLRTFDNGVVMLNLTDETWTVALDGSGWQYLDNGDTAPPYNGAFGSGSSSNTFAVPAWDGLVVNLW